jgi:hypothetical protein
VKPEYRGVPGQYYDDHGNRLVVDSKLHFIFEDRLRFGVLELEQLASRSNEIRVQRTAGIDKVRQHLNVAVTTYGFPPSVVYGVLAAIRSELVDRLADLEREIDVSRVDWPVTMPAAIRSGWISRHVWPTVVTVAAGLLVAYLSHLMGWL